MSKHRFYQVDAFTSQVFSGNPAGVCRLDDWLNDATLQNIAAENCLSETAFYVPRTNGFDLRWFTPEAEVDLCGHATLATAYVLYEHENFRGSRLLFHTRSGQLEVTRSQKDMYAMIFPSREGQPYTPDAALLKAIHPLKPAEILKARDIMVVLNSEDEIAHFKPDFALINQLNVLGLIITAPGKHCDFVSRFFAPSVGIPEDPVTGSAHCTLTPYWSPKLGKLDLNARQLSARGGELLCQYRGSHVIISGKAQLYLEGFIHLPGDA